MSIPDPARVTRALAEWGAADVPHPGGTLAQHLRRVADTLAGLGAAGHVVLAAAAHAAYGTDGFAVAPLDHTRDRDRLRALVGVPAEELVYRYGGCDRARSWPGFPATRTVTSRFTGVTEALGAVEAAAFADLTVVNELDVHRHAPPGAVPHGEIRRLALAWSGVVSPAVGAEIRRVLGPPGEPSGPG